MAAKVQISMDEGLLARLDEFADRSFCTRSGAIAMAVSQLVLQDELQRSIRTMAVAMQRIAENNEIDEQSKQELAQLQSIAAMISKSQYGTF